MGNYSFWEDLKEEKKNIRFVCSLVEDKFSVKNIESVKGPDFDLLCELEDGSELTLECKEDMMCKKTGNLAIEYESRGKPSGISVTRANWWVTTVHHEDKENVEVYFTPVKALKELIEQKKYTKKVKGGDYGSNTMMFLFKRDVIKEASQPELTLVVTSAAYKEDIKVLTEVAENVTLSA